MKCDGDVPEGKDCCLDLSTASPIVQSTTQLAPIMTSSEISRRSFLKNSTALAAAAPFLAGRLDAQSRESSAPLVAYVGTFSSPLRNMPATQVDLPPGNGRGIHLFQVNRATGALIRSGLYELGTSPSC